MEDPCEFCRAEPASACAVPLHQSPDTPGLCIACLKLYARAKARHQQIDPRDYDELIDWLFKELVRDA